MSKGLPGYLRREEPSYCRGCWSGKLDEDVTEGIEGWNWTLLCQEILWFLDSYQQKGCLWGASWNVRTSSNFLKLKLWVTLHRKLTVNKWGWDQMSCFKVWNPPKVLSRLKKWVLFSALPVINYVIVYSLLSLVLSFLVSECGCCTNTQARVQRRREKTWVNVKKDVRFRMNFNLWVLF